MIYRVLVETYDAEENVEVDPINRLRRARMKKRNQPKKRLHGAFTAGLEMDVPIPKGKFSNRAKFFFTELGWKLNCSLLLKQIMQKGLTYKVICRKNPKRSQVAYRDDFQVAVLP